jgi:hypothetical protein
MLNLFSVVVVLVTFVNLSFSQEKRVTFSQLRGRNGASGVFFGASMTPQRIELTLEGPRDRWWSVGFGTQMSNADALIYTTGKQENLGLDLYDYWMASASSAGVTKDSNSEVTIVSSENVGNRIRYVVTRPLRTQQGSNRDWQFDMTDSNLPIMWAKAPFASLRLGFHDNEERRDTVQFRLVLPPPPPVTTGRPTTTRAPTTTRRPATTTRTPTTTRRPATTTRRPPATRRPTTTRRPATTRRPTTTRRPDTTRTTRSTRETTKRPTRETRRSSESKEKKDSDSDSGEN